MMEKLWSCTERTLAKAAAGGNLALAAPAPAALSAPATARADLAMASKRSACAAYRNQKLTTLKKFVQQKKESLK